MYKFLLSSLNWAYDDKILTCSKTADVQLSPLPLQFFTVGLALCDPSPWACPPFSQAQSKAPRSNTYLVKSHGLGHETPLGQLVNVLGLEHCITGFAVPVLGF